jgi:hypothetical protein
MIIVQIDSSSSTQLSSLSLETLVQPIVSDEDRDDDESALEQFFTEDNGQTILPPLPNSFNLKLKRSGSAGLSRTLTMDTIDTYDSTDTFLSDGLIRSLKLSDLCKVIRKHRSLQHARIVAAEGYARSMGSVTHRFLLLKLERTGRRPIWLRIDRRRVKGNMFRFISRMGISEPDDSVRVLQSPTLY